MRNMECRIGLGLLAGLIAATSGYAQAPAAPTLTRLDCGKTTTLADVGRFSDVAAFPRLSIQLSFSCYLIKHGNEYLIWDTGNPMAGGATSRSHGAANQLDRSARATALEARANQVRGHQPLSRRSRRPGGIVSASDLAHRQGRLGCPERPAKPAPRSIRRTSRIGSAAAAKSSRCRATRTYSATAASSC